jgi:hypothetical protein
MESGRYQVQGRLRSTLGLAFCCLGVGHDVVSGEWYVDSDGYYYIVGTGEFMSYSSLPHSTQQLLGINTFDQEALVAANDSHGMSLQEIGMFIMLCDLAGVSLAEGRV